MNEMAEEKKQENTYVPRKDPRVQAFKFSAVSGPGKLRTLPLMKPYVTDYVTEQVITGGLGYLSKKHSKDSFRYKGKIPHYSDTNEGLKMHLRAMDDRVEFREGELHMTLLANAVESIFYVEDRAEIIFRIYEFSLRRFTKFLEKGRRDLDLGGDIEGLINSIRKMTDLA